MNSTVVGSFFLLPRFFFFFFSFFFPSRALRHRERERLFRCSISANDADEDDVDGPSSPLYSSGTLGQKEKPSSNFSSRCIRSAGVSRPLACSNVIRGNRSWKDIVSTFLSFFFCVCVCLFPFLQRHTFPEETRCSFSSSFFSSPSPIFETSVYTEYRYTTSLNIDSYGEDAPLPEQERFPRFVSAN